MSRIGKAAKANNTTVELPEHMPGTKDCPVFTTLGLIANKWSISIIHQLIQADEYTLRFNALKRLLGGITQRELTKHLRNFEESGIIRRTVYPEVPPRVEYTLTNLGTSLINQIKSLSAWAEQHGKEIQENRISFRQNRS